MSSKATSSAAKEPSKMSILSLPNILLLDILSRVSRLDYPTLSLVSTKFRTIITSSELYTTRSLLNRTEKCLYLCLHFSLNPKTIWFTLRRNPKRNVSNTSSDYNMVQIPSPDHVLPLTSSSFAAVGSNIYRIGGADKFKPWKRNYSSSVSFLDCRTHTWRQAPSMSMMRDSSSAASFVDGKMYVAGGCEEKLLSCQNWIEVFDPKSQMWGNVTNPRILELHHEHRDKPFVTKSFELGGKLYVFGDDSAVYDPKEGTWSAMEENRSMSWGVMRHRYCVVDDVLFYWNEYDGVFKWYDFKVSLWKVLKGVEGLLGEFPEKKVCKLVDLGGKMAVLWEKYEYTQYCQDVHIWCAEVVLERRDGDEIWGKVEWFDVLLTVPLQDDCMYVSFSALSASV